MWFLVVSLVAGYFLGRKKIIRGKGLLWADKLVLPCLLLLLFTMGLNLGSDPTVLGQLDTIGVKAAVLAVASIGGSVLATRVVQSLAFKELQDE